jgi:hypothetical protein
VGAEIIFKEELKMDAQFQIVRVETDKVRFVGDIEITDITPDDFAVLQKILASAGYELQ